MADAADGEGLMGRVQRDHAMWREQGVDISSWLVNPATGSLEIGVRTPVEAAAEAIRRRYGEDTIVCDADPQPAQGRSAKEVPEQPGLKPKG